MLIFLAGGYAFWHWDGLRAWERRAYIAENSNASAAQKLVLLSRDNAGLRAEIERLGVLLKSAEMSASRARVDRSSIRELSPEIAAQQKQRILSSFLQLAAGRDQFLLENGRWPASVGELVGPGKMLRELPLVDGEDYGRLNFQSGVFSVVTDSGITVRYDAESGSYPIPGTEMAGKMVPSERPDLLFPPGSLRRDIEKAIDGFRSARYRENPPQNDPSKLLPYFDNPKRAVDYLEWLEARKAASR